MVPRGILAGVSVDVIRRNWPLVAMLTLAAGVTVVYIGSGAGLTAAVAAIGAWVPTTAFALQWAYHHNQRLHLAVNRLRLSVANEDVSLHITGEFEFHGSEVADSVRSRIAETGARLEADAGRTVVWDLDDIRIRLAVEPLDPLAGGGSQLRLDLRARRGFRSLDAALERRMGPLLSVVDALCGAGDRKFVARVRFHGPNPYFGLWVANADQGQVSKFNVELRELTLGEVDVIRVSRDHVEVVSRSLRRSEVLARRYLAMVEPSRAA